MAGGLSSKLSKATSGSSSGSALGASAGGTVTVRVVRATGLLAGDKNGSSDPYVVVQSAGGKKAKTSVKKKTLDPEWDETLELSVLDAAAPLSFTVWDHDKVCTPTMALNRTLARTLTSTTTQPARLIYVLMH